MVSRPGASIWTQQPTIATLVILTIAFGALFYGAIIVSCVVYPTCPSQSPASTILLFVLQSISRSMRRLHNMLVHRSPSLLFGIASAFRLRTDIRRGDDDGDSELLHKVDALQDASAVRWIMETATDPDVITSAALMVPEVEWPKYIDISLAIMQLRNTFLGCFESTQGRHPKLGRHSKRRANACGKLCFTYTSRGRTGEICPSCSLTR
ncbi:uncharacterized protein EDB91DRAFT_284699 [Suillus paluster]|uniref:uncharacterized protein n=1 Tax=Suillus paluster TaxID=48578 RepID=UPI001B860FC0|nr:uncharacterized protein EDB91DRAFT_284699 [Suillus paluster]KAG1755274.1 hypothetical protein EDB91DRAFT_284699 [Suillus paluster]